MNYNSISSKIVIAKLEHDFSIVTTDWISSAPQWIADGLDEMELISTFEDVQLDLTVENNHVAFPSGIDNDIKRLDAIIYEDYLLNNSIITKNIARTIQYGSIQYHPTASFTTRNGYIVTSFEEGTITILFKRPKIEYDQERMLIYPYVPDNNIVINALTYYLIFCIIRKGSKIIGMDIASNNPIINPYLMWNDLKGKAKNSINVLDPEERKELSKQYRTFVKDLQVNQNIYLNTTNVETSNYPDNPYKII